MAEPPDDFEALVADERRRLATEQQRRRAEADQARQAADARAAAEAAAARRVAASARDLEALARQVAQRLTTSRTCFYFRVTSPYEGQGGTAGIVPRARGWQESLHHTDFTHLVLSTGGRLFWARGYGSRSGFWGWADLTKLSLGAHEEVRRGLARLVATHGS